MIFQKKKYDKKYTERRRVPRKRATSSLYRTAEEVRRGQGFSGSSLDGVRRKKGIAHQRVQKNFWVMLKRKRVQRKRFPTAGELFVFMGKRGIVAALLVGMFSMGSLTYIFGGSGVFAENTSPIFLTAGQRVLGAETESGNLSNMSKEEFEKKLRSMVKGYPIEDMIPFILSQDRRVAAYLVSIAKKESNWGKRIPVYYGENCFNYWGYRGQDEIMGSAGHTCFDTPKEAVSVVSKRLNRLVIEEGLTTASDLIIWKCGSSCAGHDPEGVRKWISDVDGYYKEVFAMGK